MKFNNAAILKRKSIALKKELEIVNDMVGREALGFFKESFVKQGFTDVSLKKWQPRKRTKRSEMGRGILLGPNQNMFRALKRKRLNSYTTLIYNDLIYAKVHNDGLRAGRGRGFIMPKRQFVGNSQTLTNLLKRKIKERLNYFINNYKRSYRKKE